MPTRMSQTFTFTKVSEDYLVNLRRLISGDENRQHYVVFRLGKYILTFKDEEPLNHSDKYSIISVGKIFQGSFFLHFMTKFQLTGGTELNKLQSGVEDVNISSSLSQESTCPISWAPLVWVTVRLHIFHTLSQVRLCFLSEGRIFLAFGTSMVFEFQNMFWDEQDLGLIPGQHPFVISNQATT